MKNKLRLWLIEKLDGIPLESHCEQLKINAFLIENGRLKQELVKADNTNNQLREELLKLTSSLPLIGDYTKTEHISYPWWAIVVPRQIMRKNPKDIADCIEGVYFSREAAESVLEARRDEYGKDAIVYRFSGYWSEQYKQLLKDASNFKNDNPS
jgi:hypothetical protein